MWGEDMERVIERIQNEVKYLRAERLKKQTEIECINNEIGRLEDMQFEFERIIEDEQPGK